MFNKQLWFALLHLNKCDNTLFSDTAEQFMILKCSGEQMKKKNKNLVYMRWWKQKNEYFLQSCTSKNYTVSSITRFVSQFSPN